MGEKIRTTTIGALLRSAAHRDDAEECTVEFAYQAGFLGLAIMHDVLDTGRARGLDITVKRESGLLMQRGTITVRGRWGTTRQLLEAYKMIEEGL